MNDELRRLPDAELEVMQALWEYGQPARRAELERLLQKTHPMAGTTLLTLLSRLEAKGFLRTEKQGRSGVYVPLVSRHDYLAAQSGRFVKKLCGGSLSAFAAALCDSGLTADELAELSALLERSEL